MSLLLTLSTLPLTWMWWGPCSEPSAHQLVFAHSCLRWVEFQTASQETTREAPALSAQGLSAQPTRGGAGWGCAGPGRAAQPAQFPVPL